MTRQSLVMNYAGSRLNIQVFHHGMRWHDVFSTATNPGKIAISEQRTIWIRLNLLVGVNRKMHELMNEIYST